MKEKGKISRKQFLTGGATVFLGAVLGRLSGHTHAEEIVQIDAGMRDHMSAWESEPDLSSYTEITDLSVHQYSRKDTDGKFDTDSSGYPTIADVFYAPLGTDIILTFRNERIRPYICSGADYQSFQKQAVFSSHESARFFWYHCKTPDICNYLGAYFEEDNGSSSSLTVEELQDADPHLFFRFPGKVTNTQMAARIRTKGVKKSYQRLFTVVHLTDTHGDIDSTQAAYEYADHIKADFVALTGDYVPNISSNGYNILHSFIRNANTPTVYSIGNHDVAGLSDQKAYDYNIKPVRDVLQASADHTYYYRDFQYGDGTVRAISLYPFYEKARSQDRGFYTEEQLQWLCDVMATAPNGSHIFILRHFSHHKPILLDDDKNMFYDYSDSSTEEGINFWLNMGSDPIPEIVDAYNTSSTIFAQYSAELKDHSESITVKYDFSERTDSEFVAYFTGHVHCDAVGYARNTQTAQAVLSSLCTIGWKGTENYHAYTSIHTPRDYGTDSQIALNVYTFDFEKKMIYVARVGNGLFKDREKTCMELPYK